MSDNIIVVPKTDEIQNMNLFVERKIYPSVSLCNPFLVQIIKNKKRLKYSKKILLRKNKIQA
jgi:hypothetical protein